MTANTKRIGSFAILAAIYLFAGIAGVLLYRFLPFSYWLRLLCADVAATAVLFAFSCLLGNASVYDPYWSVFPPVALTLLAFGRPLTALTQLHLIAVWVWGLRLTANWAYTFQGLDHQDWRYTMLREKSGRHTLSSISLASTWYPRSSYMAVCCLRFIPLSTGLERAFSAICLCFCP